MRERARRVRAGRGCCHTPLTHGIEHRLALPPEPGRGSVHDQSGHHERHRHWHDQPLPCPRLPPGARLRLLLRVPDRVGRDERNADLTVQPAEKAAAIVQASRFSQRCTVWAPMYRQVTVAGLKGLTTIRTGMATAYASLLAAWKDYLAHDNHGRPIIFIGHSQGAAMLIRLLQTQIDPSPRLRRRMVSAILLGGNVQVPTGRSVGGTFRNIPTCGSASQTGCVIAYSTFGSTPPANSLFGRAGRGVSLQSGQTRLRVATGGMRQSGDVLCPRRQPPAVFSQRHRTAIRRPGGDALGDLPGPVQRAVPGRAPVRPGCR